MSARTTFISQLRTWATGEIGNLQLRVKNLLLSKVGSHSKRRYRIPPSRYDRPFKSCCNVHQAGIIGNHNSCLLHQISTLVKAELATSVKNIWLMIAKGCFNMLS